MMEDALHVPEAYRAGAHGPLSAEHKRYARDIPRGVVDGTAPVVCGGGGGKGAQSDVSREQDIMMNGRKWPELGLLLNFLLILLALAVLFPPRAICPQASLLNRPVSPPSAQEPAITQSSSFSCTAGSQVFSAPLRTAGFIPSVSSTTQRMCRFRNVCLVKGRLTYYANASEEAQTPAFARLDAFGANLLYPGVIEQSLDSVGQTNEIWAGAFAPDILPAPLPRAVGFAPRDRVYLLGSLSFASNYAHLLLDTVMPAYAAALAYDFVAPHAQLININTCSTIARWSPKDIARCDENLNNWLSPFFDLPLISTHDPTTEDVCFRDLIAGHESVFGLTGQYHHRAAAIRAMRRRLYSSMGITADPPAPRTHFVLVLVKRVEAFPMQVPTLCSDFQALAASLSPPPPVQCITPATMTVEEQVRLLQHTSLIVVEHGSTAYLSLFALPGTSLILVAPETDASTFKEAPVLLSHVDIQVWYIPHPLLATEGANLMRLALRRAGASWGFQS